MTTGLAVRLKAIALCPALALLPGQFTNASESGSEPQIGRGSYIDACSICHGAFGRGDGLAANKLEKNPSDLTQLSKNNGGVFPWRYVYETIDGRQSVASHGQRDMPVWGEVWSVAVPPEYAKHADVYVNGRILELLLYLDSIQAK